MKYVQKTDTNHVIEAKGQICGRMKNPNTTNKENTDY